MMDLPRCGQLLATAGNPRQDPIDSKKVRDGEILEVVRFDSSFAMVTRISLSGLEPSIDAHPVSGRRTPIQL